MSNRSTLRTQKRAQRADPPKMADKYNKQQNSSECISAYRVDAVSKPSRVRRRGPRRAYGRRP